MESHCIRQAEIPHTTRLFTDFLYRFDRLRPFFGLAPFDEPAFFQAAEALRRPNAYPEAARSAVAAVLGKQAELFGSSDETRRNIERLRRGAVALVTGQQVGLFTGPLFAFYKALTAVRLAERLTGRGLDCVPVFWLATEDHDLAEVNHTFLMDAGCQPQRIADQAAPHVENAPVGEVTLGAGIGRETERAIALLPPAEWTGEVAEALRHCYRPGETYGNAFGRLMSRLMGRFGVVMLDPMHPQLRRLAGGVFRRAIESAPELGQALIERDQDLVKAGYHAQVHVTPNSTLLFQRFEGRRTALRRRNGEFLRDDAPVSRTELLDHLESQPEDFSSNVLLRPIVQDTLLPTVGYVGGPAEVAYMAQVSVLYKSLLGRMPVVHPRASLTLLDGQAAELIERYGVSVADVFSGPELEEKMAVRLLPEELASSLASGERRLHDTLADLRRHVGDFDPTLADAVATSARKISYQWDKVRRKAGRAAAARSETLARDFALLSGFIYPNKNLQERVYSGVSFLARFGPGLLDRLHQQISVDCGDHQVIVV